MIVQRTAGVIDLDGTEKDFETAATLAEAFDNGFDAVLLRNYITPAAKTEMNIIAVRGPEQVRSRFARFDPAEINSSDLIAGLFVAGATGLLGQMMMREKDPRNEQ